MVDFVSKAGCDRVERFSPPLEFMIEPQSARVVDWYQREHELDDEWEEGLLDAIDQFGGEKYVGIHNTDVESARSIAASGFNDSASRTISPDGIRGSAVFTWHYWADESRMLDLELSDDSATVIVVADREDVYVGEMDSSSFLLQGQLSIEEYQEEYLVHYPTFLECLMSGVTPARGYGLRSTFYKEG